MIDTETLPVIRGRRVLLRPLTDQDVPALYGIFSDPEVMRFWSHPPFTNESQAEHYLEEVAAGLESKTLFQWGLARLARLARLAPIAEEPSELLGTCTLWQLDVPNQRAEVGFILGREHWGQGLMKDGFGALIDYAFSELGIRRLEADVDPENTSSIGLLERLGFELEGRLRERWSVGGVVTDSLFYGLLERDWRKIER